MRPFLLLILAFSVASSAFAETPKEKWEGYRAVEDLRELNLPFQEFAENAVLDFETIGLTRTPGEKFEIIDVESVPKETDKKVLGSIKNYVPFQIETCRKQGIRYCPVLTYSSSATMFFNQEKFYTCRHSFHNWLALASTANGNRPVNTISPPIILRVVRDGKLRILYNSAYDGKPQLQFSFINPDPRLNFPIYQDYKTTLPSFELFMLLVKSDFTVMKLNGSMNVKDYSLPVRGPGLNVLSKGESTYLIGYPGKTDYFKNKAGDAPGFKLMASHGYAEAPLVANATLQTTNFSSQGMSGGVLISTESEILGLNCGGNNLFVTKADLVRSFPFPLDEDLMQQYWQSLSYPVDGAKQASIVDN